MSFISSSFPIPAQRILTVFGPARHLDAVKHPAVLKGGSGESDKFLTVFFWPLFPQHFI